MNSVHSNDMMLKAREIVYNYIVDHLDKTDNTIFELEDVFVVWFSKTLQNYKCLISTILSDGMYYEITYNGDKDEYYLDAYKKWENKRIKI